MPVFRHFLPWDKPLLPQAAEWLAGDWNGLAALDLSRTLAVVPTRQSGRRLREALAGYAAGRRQGVLAPRVLTPEALMAPADFQAASRLESLLAWTQVLQEIDFEGYRNVFPVDPPGRSLSWALRAAETFLGLQSTLAEGGLRMSGVGGRTDEGFPERERWRQLSELEAHYDEALRVRGLGDSQAAKIALAGDPPAPQGIERIVMMGVPDPPSLALAALAAHGRAMPVQVVIFAPEDLAGAFDEWGRPLASIWSERILELSDFERRVRLCADPVAQAEEIAGWAKEYADPGGLLGIGVADRELLPALEGALRRERFEVYDPEGISRRRGRLYPLLAALAGLAGEPSFEAVEALARCPDFTEFLRSRLGREFSQERWLSGLDRLRARHLPVDLAAARACSGGAYPEVGGGLDLVEEIRAGMAGASFAAGASAVLQSIFAARRLKLAPGEDGRLAEAASAWTQVARDCAAAAPDLSQADAWDLALRLFGEGRDPEEKPDGAIELQGWLELLWEDAPHLIVAGFNEGKVPDAVTADPFLPESLRARLGLKTNENRLARDAYFLQALAASRTEGRGRLDLLYGKAAGNGDPLKPSRLLLRCADEELPARVNFLFRSAERAQPPIPWGRAWRLEPPPPAALPLLRVAITALRDWLDCPFRFYLRHVLKMEPIDAGKGELDDLDFGTLCHTALEAMGRDEEMRECTDARTLADFLSAELDRQVRERFGEGLSLPLFVQRDSASQRLTRAAEVQARERAAGWRIEEVERAIEVEFGGLTVRGKIDRIDRHVSSGAVRLLDYKTSDAASSPAEAHLKALRAGADHPEWMRCVIGNKMRVWADLQLPFYLGAIAPVFSTQTQCGYFNLPKAVGETGVVSWENYSAELHASALRCTQEVCRAIAGGIFWPPREGVPPDRDDFARLFHRGAKASVAWGASK